MLLVIVIFLSGVVAKARRGTADETCGGRVVDVWQTCDRRVGAMRWRKRGADVGGLENRDSGEGFSGFVSHYKKQSPASDKTSPWSLAK